MFKYTIPSILQRLLPNYTWKVASKTKQIFLTFDDGPHPQITPWVLAQLKLHAAKATFFCVADNVRKFPETYTEILREGHATGNHTYHHKNGWHTPNLAYFADIELAEKYIQSTLFRPPYGRIKRSQAKVIARNYQIIMWDRLSRDYDAKLPLEESLAAMKKVENGSILVFHDSEKSFKNLQYLLPKLLEHFTLQGYQLLALPPKK